MKKFFGKVFATLVALAIGIPAGYGTVYCARALANHFTESERMDDWVLAKATVSPSTLEGAAPPYVYRFAGKDYVGTTLGVGGEAGPTFGTWYYDMVDFLGDAARSGKTVSVYVNPDNPAQSVVDRDVRFAYVAGMGALTILCGLFALGALAAIVYTWAIRDRSPNAKAWRDAGFLWIFGIIWTGFSAGISLLVLPDALADGEYAALLVLLFPLVGVLVLLGAVGSTITVIRLSFGSTAAMGKSRGSASLSLDRKTPRMGETLEGTITFPRAISPGEVMRVRLVCNHQEGDKWKAGWFREATVTTKKGPDGALVRFEFDVPAAVPPPPGASPDARWRLEAMQTSGPRQFGFDLKMQRAPQGAKRDPALDQVFGAKR